MEDSESILHAAEDVLSLLQKHGIDAVVIGAVPIGTKGADRSTQARRSVPLCSYPKASGFW